MFKIVNNKISLTRGDSAQIRLLVTSDGVPYNYDKDTIVFSVKKSTTTVEYIFQKTVENGVIYIEPEDTNDLQYGSYKYDVQLTTKDGHVCTIIPPDTFEVLPEVTWAAN